MSVYELAQRTELSERHIGEIVSGQVKKPRARTVRLIAEALDVPVEGLLDDQPGTLKLLITLPEEVADVLYALGALQRSTVESVVEREVVAYLRQRGADQSIGRIVEALQAGRSADE